MTTDSVSNSPTKNRKSQGRGRSNSLPTHVVDYLKNWLMSPEHINHPYPSEAEKARMVADAGIDIKRLNNWFVNNRIRFWKPRYEAIQKQLELEQNITKIVKSKDNATSSETSSLTPPTELPTRTSISLPVGVVQEATRSDLVVVSAPKLLDQRLNLGNSLSIAINNDDPLTVSDDDSCSSSGYLSPSLVSLPSPNLNMKKTSMFRRCRKRQRTEIEDCFDTSSQVQTILRLKYACNHVEKWKLACSSSFSSCPNLDDTNLPSLDEAVHLFGYSAVSSN
eukprot:CAMPEP_0168209576 /NCGR_PEP_ID=MMETSP0140_2-20121125/2700_1 /TAXON_ID=44445 /ORGANISM="Pseudo-nitzschia australis, Strain 10249 10 AB" /LENGTH=278 /DNA_ID=CAMNT_0008136099 /DNA_START=105 /DNA_END=942 /DNA_ORIENTATION=+